MGVRYPSHLLPEAVTLLVAMNVLREGGAGVTVQSVVSNLAPGVMSAAAASKALSELQKDLIQPVSRGRGVPRLCLPPRLTFPRPDSLSNPSSFSAVFRCPPAFGPGRCPGGRRECRSWSRNRGRRRPKVSPLSHRAASFAHRPCRSRQGAQGSEHDDEVTLCCSPFAV